MKAAILAGYNKNGRELEIRDVSKPEPGRGEVLVRVSTAGVNPLDNMIVRGEVKLIVPYSFPLVMGNERSSLWARKRVIPYSSRVARGAWVPWRFP